MALAQFPEKFIRWAQVLSSFGLMFNTWGFVNAYGVFQEYYTSIDPSIGTVDAVTWIGSIQTFLLLLGASVTGPTVDQGHARTLSATGTAVMTLSMILTSFSGEVTEAQVPVYWQVLLSQGLMCGLGMGLLMVPSTAIVPTYFTTRRAFATGLGMTGASIGGVLYPIFIRQLLPKIGLSWTLRAASLVMLVTNGVGTALIRQKTYNGSPRRLKSDFVAFKDPSFAVFVAGLWIAFVGLYVPYFYVTTWVRDIRLSLDGIPHYYLLSILNAGGLLGRIAPNLVADKIGPLLVQASSAIACGALTIGWTHSAPSLAGLVVFLVLYGFFSGAVISLVPASCSSVTADLSSLGARLGMVFALNALAFLMGSPVAGAIFRSMGNWHLVSAYSACFDLVGGLGLFIAYILERRKRADALSG